MADNDETGGPPRVGETGQGVFTLSSVDIRGGQPVAWVCQQVPGEVTQQQPDTTFNESWVYLQGPDGYVMPADGAPETYTFQYVQNAEAAWADDAQAFASWVRSQPQWSYAGDVDVIADNHAVNRALLGPQPG